MRIKFAFMFLLLSLVGLPQKKDCKISNIIIETISLYDSLYHRDMGFPEDEKANLNFQVYLINSNDLLQSQVDKNDSFRFEFYEEIPKDSSSFIVSVAKKHFFDEDIIPQCIFDFNSSKILFYDYEKQVLSKKKNNKKIREISHFFGIYSSAYLTWLVKVEGNKVRITEMMGYYSPYNK